MLVVLGSRGSRFTAAVAEALRAVSVSHRSIHVLDLDAPFDGEPLSVGPDFVRWGDVELTLTEAMFVERPLFAWPQPITAPAQTQSRSIESTSGARSTSGTETKPAAEASHATKGRHGEARRELASLRLSAILTVAARAPVLNPPHAAELALSPVLALDALAARGVAVHPWRYGPREAGARAWRDAVGRVADYEPRAPEVGEPGWSPEPLPESLGGALTTVLVCGESLAACAEHAGLAEWATGDAARSARAPEELASGLSDAVAALARRATAELELAFAAVTLHGDGEATRVVDVDAAPDLEAWDRARHGAVAGAIARMLVQAADAARSRST